MMKKEEFMRKCFLFAFASFALVSCESVFNMFGMEPDNSLEEFVENVIEEETKLKIDLTPMTPEK